MPAYLEHHDGTSWGHPAMISSLGSSSTTATLQKFFSKADANSDSSLSKDELLSALEGTSVSSDSDKLSSAVDSLVGSLDSDKNGSLSATEFSSFSSQFDYGSGSALLAALVLLAASVTVAVMLRLPCASVAEVMSRVRLACEVMMLTVPAAAWEIPAPDPVAPVLMLTFGYFEW